MKNSEIKDFLSTNDDSNVSFYLSTIIEKLKDISRENNKIGIFMIVVIFLFYLIENSIARSINIGPISIDDLTAIKVFIPLFFAFLILRYKVINSHKAELIKISKKITEHKFGIDNSNIKPEFTDDFTRSLLPLSLYEEVIKLNYKGTSFIGCLGTILTIPITIILALVPYFFELLWLKEQLYDFLNYNLYEKASFILTIWVLVFSLYYMIHTMSIAIKEAK
jgi:hypothetical protein